ncbi:ABC transporter ATP-binding protein [candidate division WOR-3 bacterium]|nr:ABC transporter ATP-binding protein [candidate division WOR-3 bacterium]
MIFSGYKTALSVVLRASKKILTARIFLTTVRAVFPVVMLYIIKLFVDSVAEGMSSQDAEKAFLKSIILIVAAGLSYALSFIADSLNEILSEYHSLRITDKVFEMLHDKSSEIDIAFYENPDYYDTLHRAQREAPYRPTAILNQMFSVFQNFLTFIGVAALILSFSRIAGIVLLAAVVPGTLVQLAFAKIVYKWQKKVTKHERETWYYNFLLSSEQNAKELRLFGAAGLFKERFNQFRKMLRGQLLSIKKKRAGADLAAQTLSSAILASLLVYLTSLAYSGAMSLGNLVMFFQAFQRGQGNLRGILGGFVGLYESGLFMTYFSDFLSLKSGLKKEGGKTKAEISSFSEISVREAAFKYPGSKTMAIQGLNMNFRKGEITAMVGANGSGKTTVAKLLCRFYDPDEGAIFADGDNIRRFEPEEWRKFISASFQDFQKYQLSAEENIWLGDISGDKDSNRILSASEKTGAKEVIQKLENGFSTRLGRWFENGRELSAGEWQKMALARCMYKNAGLYILDEPAAFLDYISEKTLMKALKEKAKNSAIILISHRFSDVAKADYIYVLDGGRIVEQGSHKELILKNGLYAESFLGSVKKN